jgi:DNA-binding GntR family transcriptional regulator
MSPKDAPAHSGRNAAPHPGKPGARPARPHPPVRLVGLSVTLPAAIAEQLRERIIEGEFAPGSRLNERKLCDRLGVSRTPLREAFRLLESDGLVELHPNRGAHIVSLSENDVRESFELMGALEALSGELACRHITDSEINEIKAFTFQMLACHARRDLPAYYHLNRIIHDRINQAARNSQLTQTYATLNLRIQNLRFRSNFDDDKWNKAAREHEAMAAALEARDGGRLSSILRNHLRQKGEAVLDMMRATQAHGSEPERNG